MARWQSSFLDFLWDCIRTTDEGVGEVRLAPRMRYLKEVDDAVQANKQTIIVKSRQMFFTHYFAAYYLWMVMFHENVRLAIMNQNEDDAADLMETRIKPLYERLPEEYPWPELVIKRLTIINEKMTSRIVATSSTSNRLRGKTFTRVWLDEFGFQDNQEATLRSAMAASKGPIAKLIINSTPVPKSLYEELGRKLLDVNFEPIEKMQGVTEYRNTRGHCVLYVHHTADPDKRSEEWIEQVKKEEGELAYSVEYDLKWLLPVGKPVFAGFNRSMYCGPYKKHGIVEGVTCEDGWDFGGHHPAWVRSQRLPTGQLITHKAVMAVDMDLYKFMDLIEEIIEREFKGLPYNMYCDPAGAAVNGQGTALPAQRILEQRFHKKVRSIKSAPSQRVTAMKQLMGKLIDSEPGWILHPLLGEVHHADGQIETGVMIEGFETGLVYDKLRGGDVGVHKLTYKKDQWFEHLFDSCGYKFIYLYPGLMPIDFQRRMEEREGLIQHRRHSQAARRRSKLRR